MRQGVGGNSPPLVPACASPAMIAPASPATGRIDTNGRGWGAGWAGCRSRPGQSVTGRGRFAGQAAGTRGKAATGTFPGAKAVTLEAAGKGRPCGGFRWHVPPVALAMRQGMHPASFAISPKTRFAGGARALPLPLRTTAGAKAPPATSHCHGPNPAPHGRRGAWACPGFGCLRPGGAYLSGGVTNRLTRMPPCSTGGNGAAKGRPVALASPASVAISATRQPLKRLRPCPSVR